MWVSVPQRQKPPLPIEQAQTSSFKKSLQPPQIVQSRTFATKSALIDRCTAANVRFAPIASALVARRLDIDRYVRVCPIPALPPA
jgi:hypothetical protein